MNVMKPRSAAPLSVVGTPFTAVGSFTALLSTMKSAQ
jgi:hypothetical protein